MRRRNAPGVGTPLNHPNQKRPSVYSSPAIICCSRLIAAFVGLVISGISLRTACRQSAHSFAWPEQWVTEFKLREIGKAVFAYQQASNACPGNFDQLQPIGQTFSDLQDYFRNSNDFVDGWGHSLVFSKEGTNCLVMSYGQDGKPGGIGIDCDLTTEHPLPIESVPTFRQFWASDRTRDMITWCFICGAMAGVLSFWTVRNPNFTKRGLILLGLSLAATIIGTIFVAAIITALHVPSGH